MTRIIETNIITLYFLYYTFILQTVIYVAEKKLYVTMRYNKCSLKLQAEQFITIFVIKWCIRMKIIFNLLTNIST